MDTANMKYAAVNTRALEFKLNRNVTIEETKEFLLNYIKKHFDVKEYEFDWVKCKSDFGTLVRVRFNHH